MKTSIDSTPDNLENTPAASTETFAVYNLATGAKLADLPVMTSGQVCISVERLFVEAPVYDRFVEQLVEQVKKLRIGSDPAGNNNVDLGPMTFPGQLEVVERQVADARARGTNVLSGG
ncbi:MAG: aldehyde dehydrogenase [Chloroflexi bacterium]|jgi:acyl-CoA reductase-like NAD-dependent aldehyde dehydrogenase|nr:aldehyde dehydrogenase [Chloroflexota bacterium]